MQEVLLVNPKKRTKKASPAQLRARAKFAAMARAKSIKANPVKKARKTRTRKTRTAVTVRPARSVKRRVARRSVRRSNPISLGGAINKPMQLLKPAMIGALGATAVNTALQYIPLPATFNTGKMRFVTQGVAAIALGMIAGKLGAKATVAAQMAEGSLTVTLHEAIKSFASDAGMQLSGYRSPAQVVRGRPRLSQFVPNNTMGQFVNNGVRVAR